MLEGIESAIEWQQLPSMIALQLVWQRHYEVVIDNRVHCRVERTPTGVLSTRQ